MGEGGGVGAVVDRAVRGLEDVRRFWFVFVCFFMFFLYAAGVGGLGVVNGRSIVGVEVRDCCCGVFVRCYHGAFCC